MSDAWIRQPEVEHVITSGKGWPACAQATPGAAWRLTGPRARVARRSESLLAGRKDGPVQSTGLSSDLGLARADLFCRGDSGRAARRFDRFSQARTLKFGPSSPHHCEMRATIQRVLHHRRNCSHPLLKSELRVFFL
jgi:hypothetical protein